jgi:glutamyl-tRNA synthetase
MIGGRWVACGLLKRPDSPFVAAALGLVQNSLEVVAGVAQLARLDFTQTISSRLRTVSPPRCLLPASTVTSDSLLSFGIADADGELRALLGYPLGETVGSDAAKAVLEDNFQEVAAAVLAAHDSGELATALGSGHDGYKKWVNSVGKAQGRKGKRLFMPMRVAFTGRTAGPDVGEVLSMLALEDGDVAEAGALVALPQRMEQLRVWLQANGAPPAQEAEQ